MAKEINLTLTGYRADEVLPEPDEGCLVFAAFKDGSGIFFKTRYGAKHGAWNTYDAQTAEEAEKTKLDSVTHWFRLPEAPEAKGAAHHD